MPRLFVAIPVPDTIKSRTTSLYQHLPDVRWIPSENIHITLTFIGEVDNTVCEEIAIALGNISAVPFELSLRGLGHFSGGRGVKVIWTGIEGTDLLAELKKQIDRELNSLSVDLEKRKFVPHLTLGRIKKGVPQGFHDFMNERKAFRTESFAVDSFQLYASKLTSDGPIYSIVEDYPLSVS